MFRARGLATTAIALATAGAAAWAQAYDQQGYSYPEEAEEPTIEQLIADMQPRSAASQSVEQPQEEQQVYTQPARQQPAIQHSYAQEEPADTSYQQQAFDQQDYQYQTESQPRRGLGGWISGDWYLKVGVAGLVGPRFEGAAGRTFRVQPLISLGKHGRSARFTSRNDNISLAVIDTGAFRAGAAGKLIWGRDDGTHADLVGLSPVKFGGEAGGFVEVYPSDFVRLRGEVRHGVRSHDGLVADVAADAFFDVTDSIQISGGPRASWASSEYFEAYYGVDAAEAAASGLTPYTPGSGMKSVGLGGAVTWKATDRIATSVFAEYARLLGPAADSSLVIERGSKNQVSFGASATYRFDLFR